MALAGTLDTQHNLWLCQCCIAHGGGRLLHETVTCPECRQPCSCEGCVADVQDGPGPVTAPTTRRP